LGTSFGLPGQMLFVCILMIVGISLFVWFGNRQGAAGCR
jgi:hypothetical protein